MSTSKKVLIGLGVTVGVFVVLGVILNALPAPNPQVAATPSVTTSAAVRPASTTSATSATLPHTATHAARTSVSTPTAVDTAARASGDPILCGTSGWERRASGTAVMLQTATAGDGPYRITFTMTDGSTRVEYLSTRFDGAQTVEGDYDFTSVREVTVAAPGASACTVAGP